MILGLAFLQYNIFKMMGANAFAFSQQNFGNIEIERQTLDILHFCEILKMQQEFLLKRK